MKLVATKKVSLQFGIKEPTLRSWIRQELIAGCSGRPSLVEIDSLIDYLISKRANTKLLKLYSSSNHASVATPVDDWKE